MDLFLHEVDVVTGPFTPEQIELRLANNEINGNTLAYPADGTSEWISLSNFRSKDEFVAVPLQRKHLEIVPQSVTPMAHRVRRFVAVATTFLSVTWAHAKPRLLQADERVAAFLLKAPFKIPKAAFYGAVALLTTGIIAALPLQSRDVMDTPFDGSSEKTLQRSYARFDKEATSSQKTEFGFALGGIAPFVVPPTSY